MADRKTILIVDDEADARAFVETVISEMGDFNICSASCGNNALEKAQTEKPDLIILDVMMPDKSGFQVFSELRRNEATASIAVIMLTGVSEETGMKFSGDDMGEFLGDPPAAFLDKPVDPAKLTETIKSVLGL